MCKEWLGDALERAENRWTKTQRVWVTQRWIISTEKCIGFGCGEVSLILAHPNSEVAYRLKMTVCPPAPKRSFDNEAADEDVSHDH